jgi:hypothetical protein
MAWRACSSSSGAGTSRSRAARSYSRTQEGGSASSFAELPPVEAAASFRSTQAAYSSGQATGRALDRVGVDVDLARVLDQAGGPLGCRHLASPAYGLAFALGLSTGGTEPCVKHFPGLGSAPISTDESPQVHARLLPAELAAFERAIAASAGSRSRTRSRSSGAPGQCRPFGWPCAPAPTSCSSRTAATRRESSAPSCRSPGAGSSRSTCSASSHSAGS